MDGREMQWNTELTKIHHTNYVRNSRAITVGWFVFSACYTILNIVAFIQPFWFGDTDESPGVGYFGLYEYCERVQGSDFTCQGNFLDFNSLLNDYFRAAAFLVGGAALLFIFSIICMILFMFLKARIVLRICGCLQLIAALFMIVACIVYPAGFDDVDVKRICGQQAEAYMMDKCQIRWAYILAIVLIFDALILAGLAFVLAARQAREIVEFKKLKEDHMSYIREWRDKSYINRGFYGSNKNFPDPAQPVRKRHSYTSLDTSNFGKSTALSTQGDTPLTSQGNPVGNIRQSPRSSRPSSLRSSSRSPRSVSTSRSQQSPRSTDGQQMENDIMEGFDNIAALPSDTDSYTSTSPTSRNMKPSVSTDPSDIHL